MYKFNTNLKKLARENRNNPTYSEKIFWNAVRDHSFRGLKFVRQFAIGNYIYDFYCDEKKLLIEIDGATHQEKEVQENDKRKEKFAIENGYNIVRFTDEEVIGNFEKVEMKLREILGL